ncbi:hypothetical protein, partial [Aeromonas veronii]|uniref:hypothetical protein n=1 Tax=Aeromonas veronii TaxID=654 RepID=UPI003D22355B
TTVALSHDPEHESAWQLLGYSVHYAQEHQPNLTRAGIGEHNAFALTCRLDADVPWHCWAQRL